MGENTSPCMKQNEEFDEMTQKTKTGRKILRNMRPTVLQQCSFAERILPFLLAFVFLFPLNFFGKISDQSAPSDPSPSPAPAQAALDSAFYARYPYVIIIDDDEDIGIDISDEYFYRNAALVEFTVAKSDLPTDDKTLSELREKVLPQISRDSLRVVRLKLRGSASPDGPAELNRLLSQKRQQALYDFVKDCMQIPQGDSLLLETATEDYTYLYKRMMQDGDPDCEKVKRLFDEYMPSLQYTQLKRELQAIDGGRLWHRLLVTYFPSLRSARMVIVCQRKPEPKPKEEISPIMPISPITPTEETEPYVMLYPRRELLSVKTNLLFYGVYMPGYNRWCPIPNIAFEYYPLRGHFTFGGSFDCPWWQNYAGHKYFQVRNYQLETRYYFRSGNIDRRPEGKGAAFRGWYLQAYGHVGLFGICFDENRGWTGEGLGGGLGVGYVMPLSKKGHWKLEFQLQGGIFYCGYDPYQYENPVTDAYRDGLYYYKWTQKASLFQKRQYRFTWIGPTRVGITLSYDLVYRKARKKTNGIRCPEGTQPTRRYNPFVPYEREQKGGAQ